MWVPDRSTGKIFDSCIRGKRFEDQFPHTLKKTNWCFGLMIKNYQ